MFSAYSHTGFYYSTVSKVWLMLIAVASLAIHLPLSGYREKLICTYESIFERFELWRLLTTKLAFANTRDTICGMLLLYYFRIFERRFGSQKFASRILSVLLVSTLFELAFLTIAHSYLDIRELAFGPHSIIISWFVPYAIDVPRMTITHVLGVPVTGKSFLYILGLQLASGSTENALSSACGLLVGALHHFGCIYIDRIHVPLCVADWVEAYFARFIHSRPDEFESRQQLNVGATLELQRAQQIERLEQEMMLARHGASFSFANLQRQFPAPAAPNTLSRRAASDAQLAAASGSEPHSPSAATASDEPPSAQFEANAARLVEMGFERTHALAALVRTGNDLDMAMNALLNAG